MSQAIKRTALRTIHLMFSIPILGYVYSPFDNLPQYAMPTRYIFMPVLIISGLWMWLGPAVRRRLGRRSS